MYWCINSWYVINLPIIESDHVANSMFEIHIQMQLKYKNVLFLNEFSMLFQQ